jgi:hypothetical protein
MTIADFLMKPIVNLMVERPGRKLPLAGWAQKLAESGEAINKRVATAQTPQGAATLRHITGIERWGQRRLQVALGEPFVLDEYDGYQPAADADLATLREAFRTTRQATVELAQKLAAAGVSDEVKIRHNQFGPVTVRGWLSYLTTHANFESKRIR